MASRPREGRRKRPSRAPGIWRGRDAPGAGRAETQHGARSRALIGARVFSGLILISLLTLLFLFFSADAFYVRSISVGGLNYMTKEEVFALVDVAGLHIFWVDPQSARKSLLRSPTIADARVEVGWPPDMVKVIVQERQPALVWEQAGVATWVDLQGRVMRQREDRADLIRITVDRVVDTPLGPQSSVDAGVVAGALQLQTLFPNIAILRYNPVDGLGYQDGRGWIAWFGSGTSMPEKILVYNAIVDDLLARGAQPAEVNVVNPDAPYYSVFPGQ